MFYDGDVAAGRRLVENLARLEPRGVQGQCNSDADRGPIREVSWTERPIGQIFWAFHAINSKIR